METCFNATDREKGFISSDERRHITKIRKLQEANPDKVRIIKQPEENDGCIYAEVPAEWFSIRPPKKMNLTDEQRQEISDRLRRIRMDGPV